MDVMIIKQQIKLNYGIKISYFITLEESWINL